MPLFGRSTVSRSQVLSPARVKADGPGSHLEVVERALTAAGVQIEKRNAAEMRRVIQPWQSRALAYYDLVGECWFASQFYARHLSQIRLYVGIYDEDGEIEELEEDNEATALLDRIRDPGGTDRKQLQGSYGRLMFITGEGYLTVTQPPDEEERWEFLSSDELRVNSDDTYTRFFSPGLQAVTYRGVDSGAPGEEATVYRLWRKHPRYSAWADSPMKGVLDLFGELLLLQEAVAARVKSRLSAAGILFIPEEITIPSQDTQAADEDILDDPLLNELVESANAAIREPGTASAVVPIIARVAGDWIEKIKHIQFFDPAVAYPETGLRNEVIRRIAMGIDMPPEILLGLADSNHWTSWQIDEQTARAHIFPICQMLCDDLTSAYLRPEAKKAGIDDWENLVVGFDASAIVVSPDRAKDAIALYREGELSGETLRESSGFDDSDAPAAEEKRKWIGLQLKDAKLALDGVEATPPPPQLPPGALPGDDPVPVPAPEKGPPPAQPGKNGAPMVATAGASPEVERVLGAADLAVTRARGLAGARLRSKLDGDRKAEFVPVANHDLAAALGGDLVLSFNVPMTKLVQGSTVELESMMRGLGFDGDMAQAFCSQIEIHAAQTLLQERPSRLPDGLRVMLETRR